MSRMRAQATLIGDVVASRATTDRAALHARLSDALAVANDRWHPAAELRITVGDEYQGRFDDVGSAVRAALRLRLALAPDVDVRHGVGWGTVEVLNRRPPVEDGPGWWAARAAIDGVRELATRPAQRSARTGYRPADGVDGAGAPEPAAVNAALALLDAMVAGLSDESVIVVRDLLDGRTQREISDRLGVSASALSQRVRRDGLAVVVRAEALLAEVN